VSAESILKKLGLNVWQVRRALGTPEPPPFEEKDLSGKKYLMGYDQKRIQRRLKIYEGFMIARFLEGWHPRTVGTLLNCSEEAVRIRLRKAGFF